MRLVAIKKETTKNIVPKKYVIMVYSEDINYSKTLKKKYKSSLFK